MFLNDSVKLLWLIFYTRINKLFFQDSQNTPLFGEDDENASLPKSKIR